MIDLLELFSSNGRYILFIVATGAALLGAIGGLVGSMAMLKKQSLLSDVVAHASLPGIVLAYMVTGVRAHSVFLLGAGLAGWLAAIMIFMLVKKGRVKQDSAHSLLLASYFGFGMVLLSYIQKMPDAGQAGIETFLFGQAATMLYDDVVLVAIVGIAIVLLLFLFWKELFVLIFDHDYATSLGLPIFKLELVFSLILVGSVVIGLQVVGVVLMSAMLVTPAIAARQWSNNFRIMLPLSAIFGAISGIVGSVLSSVFTKLPTGPAIIAVVSFIAIVSILFAPCRGIYWRRSDMRRKCAEVRPSTLLGALYQLSLQHDEVVYGHSVNVLRSLFPHNYTIERVLGELSTQGFAVNTAPGMWSITIAGKEVVEDYRDNVLTGKVSAELFVKGDGC